MFICILYTISKVHTKLQCEIQILFRAISMQNSMTFTAFFDGCAPAYFSGTLTEPRNSKCRTLKYLFGTCFENTADRENPVAFRGSLLICKFFSRLLSISSKTDSEI